jgi:hypothetical protein
MDPTKPESYEWMTPEARPRRKHRRKERVRSLRRKRAFNRTLAIASLLAAAVVIGGAAVAAALYLTKPPPPPPPSLAEGEHPKAVTGDPRFVGIWITDVDLTIDELRKTERMSEQKELEYRRSRPVTAVTFTDTTLTIQSGAEPSTQKYTVVPSNADALVFKTWFASTQKDEEVRVRFVAPDVLKFDSPNLKMMDYFRRIKPPVVPGPPPDEKPPTEKTPTEKTDK